MELAPVPPYSPTDAFDLYNPRLYPAFENGHYKYVDPIPVS